MFLHFMGLLAQKFCTEINFRVKYVVCSKKLKFKKSQKGKLFNKINSSSNMFINLKLDLLG
jgi:hypothetical protein